MTTEQEKKKKSKKVWVGWTAWNEFYKAPFGITTGYAMMLYRTKTIAKRHASKGIKIIQVKVREL